MSSNLLKSYKISTGKGRTKRRGAGGADAGAGPLIPKPSMLSRDLMGVAQSLKRTLCFVEGTTAVIGSTYNEATVIMNGAYQPYASTSPAGYLKYMALYSKCFVLASRIRLRGPLIQTAGARGFVVGLTITTNTTSLASFPAAIENGLCRYAVVGVHPDRVNLTLGVDVKKFLHKPNVLDDPQLFSTSTANPTQLVVCHFWTQALAGSPTATFDAVVEVELDVVFTDPIPFT